MIHSKRVQLRVNGREHTLDLTPQATLLHVLRNDVELNGPKYGCGLGECGSCTVLVDKKPARSCVIPVLCVIGREITTLEGLPALSLEGQCLQISPNESLPPLHPVQRAFIDAQAAQCGYCLNGMIMMTVALLLRNPQPSRQEVIEALSANLCRCVAHVEILKAVDLAVSYSQVPLKNSLSTLKPHEPLNPLLKGHDSAIDGSEQANVPGVQ